MINYFNVKPVKYLTVSLRRSNGRNLNGRITSFHRGGGVRRRYRLLDFKRFLLDIPAFIRRFEYDPVRTAYITLICYANGVLSYSLMAEGLAHGDLIFNTYKSFSDFSVGMSSFLKNFSIGSNVFGLGLVFGKSSVLVRSAGSFAKILRKIGLNDYVTVKLPSGEIRMLNSKVIASFGRVSNTNHKNVALIKAGQNRLFGLRPVVRGVAMNPIDHPHGGNTSGGRPSVSPWGKLAKGGKTRNRRRTSSNFILRSRTSNY